MNNIGEMQINMVRCFYSCGIHDESKYTNTICIYCFHRRVCQNNAFLYRSRFLINKIETRHKEGSTVF